VVENGAVKTFSFQGTPALLPFPTATGAGNVTWSLAETHT
jgi:hypothetical protein